MPYKGKPLSRKLPDPFQEYIYFNVFPEGTTCQILSIPTQKIQQLRFKKDIKLSCCDTPSME